MTYKAMYKSERIVPVRAKNSPDRSGTELFTLHEGTKVLIHETVAGYANIEVGNYNGWIPLTTLERI